VRVLVRPSSDTRALRRLDLERAVGALDDKSALLSATKGVERVFNCAGLSRDYGPFADFYRANVQGLQNLLQASFMNGVARVVHLSTSDIYGYPEAACDEEHGFHDRGLPYNRSKGMADEWACHYHARTGLPITLARPASVFGPRSKDFVVELCRLLVSGQMLTIGGGNAPAGLLYIDDLVDVLIDLSRAPRASGQAYNLRDPAAMTWREYVDSLSDGLGLRRVTLDVPEGLAMVATRALEAVYKGFRVRSRPPLTRHAVSLMARTQAFCIRKAQRDVGFKPRVGLREGIARTLAWLKTDEAARLVPELPGVHP
jgi:nucleoside-diphosphate-sugar epimerase